jgi:hypothetical protein
LRAPSIDAPGGGRSRLSRVQPRTRSGCFARSSS